MSRMTPTSVLTSICENAHIKGNQLYKRKHQQHEVKHNAERKKLHVIVIKYSEETKKAKGSKGAIWSSFILPLKRGKKTDLTMHILGMEKIKKVVCQFFPHLVFFFKGRQNPLLSFLPPPPPLM